jgi:hypothetical protein
MPLAPRIILSFGDCDIDVERRELRRANTAMNVEPQVFDLLVYLVRNGDRVLSKDEIFASVCEQLANTAWSAGTTAAVLHYVLALAGFALTVRGSIEIGCLCGTAGSNVYGPDPFAR